VAKTSVLAKLTTKDGKGDELVAAFDGLFKQVDTETGTLLYILNQANDDPNVYWFYELYTDDAALGAHSGSDAMKQLMGGLGDIIAGAEMIVGKTVAGKGL
jgi:quinol monooxygenase YgiN